MKSKIIEAKLLVPGDKVTLNFDVETKETCVLFVGIVGEDDELFTEFVKFCK